MDSWSYAVKCWLYVFPLKTAFLKSLGYVLGRGEGMSDKQQKTEYHCIACIQQKLNKTIAKHSNTEVLQMYIMMMNNAVFKWEDWKNEWKKVFQIHVILNCDYYTIFLWFPAIPQMSQLSNDYDIWILRHIMGCRFPIHVLKKIKIIH